MILYGNSYANLTMSQERDIAKHYINNPHKTKVSFEKERNELQSKIVKNNAEQVATINEIGIIVNGIGEHAVPKSLPYRYHKLNCELRELGVKLATLNHTNPKYRDQNSEDFAVSQLKKAFEECPPEDY